MRVKREDMTHTPCASKDGGAQQGGLTWPDDAGAAGASTRGSEAPFRDSDPFAGRRGKVCKAYTFSRWLSRDGVRAAAQLDEL